MLRLSSVDTRQSRRSEFFISYWTLQNGGLSSWVTADRRVEGGNDRVSLLETTVVLGFSSALLDRADIFSFIQI